MNPLEAVCIDDRATFARRPTQTGGTLNRSRPQRFERRPLYIGYIGGILTARRTH